MLTFWLIIIAIIGYMFGSVNGAIIASNLLFRQDVRDYGSHNAGLTNFHRTYGTTGMAIVLGIDMFKGAIPVLLRPAARSVLCTVRAAGGRSAADLQAFGVGCFLLGDPVAQRANDVRSAGRFPQILFLRHRLHSVRRLFPAGEFGHHPAESGR